jgi:membrane protease YdiL (CAAX protease family)
MVNGVNGDNEVNAANARPPGGSPPASFAAEWRDFLRFCSKPTFGRRFRSASPRAGWLMDWVPAVSFRRLLAWAAVLWGINLFVFGPIAVGIAHKAGATHRVDVENLPWLLALVWAPLIEEMLFRYGLRRPGIALWLVPLMGFALWHGPGLEQSMLFLIAIFLLYRSTRYTPVPSPRARVWLRSYRNSFFWVFHLSVIAFAVMHIYNFSFQSIAWWMVPLLVLPQWFTGLVLGWMRVTRGIAAAILLHALFNLGPLLLAWLTLKAIHNLGVT